MKNITLWSLCSLLLCVQFSTAQDDGSNTETLPSPWQFTDIGDPVPGNADFENDVFTIQGTSGEIFNTADKFHFIYQPFSGDIEFVAKIPAEVRGKYGLMIRETLEASSRNAMMERVDADRQFFQWRDNVTGFPAVAGPNISGPTFLKIVKIGDRISGFSSIDGIDFNQIGSITIADFTDNFYIGFAATALTATTMEARFEEVSIKNITLDPDALPEPWAFSNIGNPEDPGNAGFLDGKFQIEMTNGEIFKERDTLQYVYQQVSGDLSFVAKITAEESGKYGLMIRENLEANARNAMVERVNRNRQFFQWRSGVGGGSKAIEGPNLSGPVFFKITRAGDVISAFSSTDGVDFELLGTREFTALPEDLFIGFAATALSSSPGTRVDFEPINLETFPLSPDDLPTPWEFANIGNPEPPGIGGFRNDVFSILATKGEINLGADDFQYIYQPRSGDISITARLNAEFIGKHGLMIRSSLEADAAHYMIERVAPNKFFDQWRDDNGGAVDGNQSGLLTGIPYYLKLIKQGTTITALTSFNGETFQIIGQRDMPALSGDFFIGLASTAQLNGREGVFEIRSEFYEVAISTTDLALPPEPVVATVYVRTDGADTLDRDGLTPETAFKSLAYACDRTAAGSTILMGPGEFEATRAAVLKSDYTLVGNGAEGPDATVIKAAPDWKTIDGLPEPRTNQVNSLNIANYLAILNPKSTNLGQVASNLSISDIKFMSNSLDPEELIEGGVLLRDVTNVTFKDVVFENFIWTGIRLIAVADVEVSDAVFKDASFLKQSNEWGGNIQTNVITNGSFHDILFLDESGTQSQGNSIKGQFHTNLKIFNCDFTQDGGGFDIEFAFSRDSGVEMFNNKFDAAISFPQSGGQGDPNEKGFDYSIWIHDNMFTSSYSFEGPKDYLRINNNFFDVQSTGGRIYSQFGGNNPGPVEFYNNTLVNVDRGFFWKVPNASGTGNFDQNGDPFGRLDNVKIYNNTVYLADAANRTEPIFNFDNLREFNGWEVKNNIFVADEARPRLIYNAGCTKCSTIDMTNNLFVNVQDNVANNFYDEDPGLTLQGEQPAPFFAPLSAASFVVDKGVEMGIPFIGDAPDLGAFEFTPVAPETEIIGEMGNVTTRQEGKKTWYTVNLNNVYENPIVVMGPVERKGAQPVTIRIDSITNNSFNYQIDEWDYLDGSHIPETISYLVVEAGVHELTNGKKIVAGKEVAAINQKWRTVDFGTALSETPVVLTQISSYKGNQAVVTRQRDITSTDFGVRVFEEKKNDGKHVREDMDWIAIETGIDSEASTNFEVTLLDQGFDQQFRSVNFIQSYSNEPVVVAAIQTDNDLDPAGLRFINKSSSAVEIKVEEENSTGDGFLRDADERIGYVVFGAPGNLEGISLNMDQAVALKSQLIQNGDMEGGFFKLGQNPVATTLSFAYDLNQDQSTKIVIYDLMGRQVAFKELTELSKGQHVDQMDVSKLPTGIYIVKADFDKQVDRILKIIIE